jgi:hypothetical protein
MDKAACGLRGEAYGIEGDPDGTDEELCCFIGVDRRDVANVSLPIPAKSIVRRAA